MNRSQVPAWFAVQTNRSSIRREWRMEVLDALTGMEVMFPGEGTDYE